MKLGDLANLNCLNSAAEPLEVVGGGYILKHLRVPPFPGDAVCFQFPVPTLLVMPVLITVFKWRRLVGGMVLLIAF